jgi:hypothetical protein
MALNQSEVYRCLEKKTLIFGFEVVDLFLAFGLLTILNLAYAGVRYKFLWTWGPAALLSLTLRIGKAGKPENYLVHWVRYQVSPGLFSAFPLARFKNSPSVLKERE